jgi:hypothetical protein
MPGVVLVAAAVFQASRVRGNARGERMGDLGKVKASRRARKRNARGSAERADAKGKSRSFSGAERRSGHNDA